MKGEQSPEAVFKMCQGRCGCVWRFLAKDAKTAHFCPTCGDPYVRGGGEPPAAEQQEQQEALI